MPPGGGGSDKLQHFVTFLGLAVLGLAAWPGPGRWLPIAGGLLALGAGIEVLQPLTGRDRSFADLVADFLGLAAAVVPVILWEFLRRRRTFDERGRSLH